LNYLNDLKSIVSGNLLENEPMSKHTTYGVGGPVTAFINPKDSYDLAKILQYSNKKSIPTYFIGSGSNLLIADQGIDGIVLSPAKSLKKLEIKKNLIFAESGVMLGKMVKESIKNNLTGLESLIGVPGTLGGALSMNAGAFGEEISNYLQSVQVMNMNGIIKEYKHNEINFSYRFSDFKENEFILNAQFKLKHDTSFKINKKRKITSQNRKSSQPLKFRSAGSVFKNDKKYSAGFLIDQSGLKGTRFGDAEISPIHANFFINHGNAKSSDILKLISIARKKVFKKYKIFLELEIKIIGFKNKELRALNV
tara:strand:+ start:589 stop:1515 length:927 start_codon:yes stop_codon:yes gene_type:complete